MKSRALIASLALAALATGCTEAQPPDETNTGVNGPLVEETVELRDGSTITCLTYDRALDCDWSTR